MPFVCLTPAQIVVRPSVRGLCVRPYEGHPRGCPNYGKRATCPPDAPLLSTAFDLSAPAFLIWNVFPFGAHVAAMRAKHPEWSPRQLGCCLYWQGTARKQLRAEIARFRLDSTRYDGVSIGGYAVTTCPEAMGLDVTATCENVGVHLEWPPETSAVQVAFAGRANPRQEAR